MSRMRLSELSSASNGINQYERGSPSASLFHIVWMILISHDTRKFLSFVNHLLYFACNRNSLYKVLFSIDLFHLCYKIFCIAVCKFLYGVNSCSLKKLGKLRTYSLYPEKVGMVAPFEDEFLRNACLLSYCLASFRTSAFFKKLFYFYNSCSLKLFCISRAYTFDVNYFVCHSIVCFVVKY